MARLLMRALKLSGHTVALVSEFRSYLSDPDADAYSSRKASVEEEIARIDFRWRASALPDLWLTYHPYYKAPDLIGPRLAARFGFPYLTAEASWSPRRFVGTWEAARASVLAALHQASLNLCMTRRDRDGLAAVVNAHRLAMLPPFIDVAPFTKAASGNAVPRLVTVAMMRRGDKMDSYRMLGATLAKLLDSAWTLTVVGDGECRSEVEAALAPLGERVAYLGEQLPEAMPELLSECDVMIWPGVGEAYGIAYLEAQASGLPVVAQAIAGVPEVVRHDQTGLLAPPGDVDALAGAVRSLLTDRTRRRQLGMAARRFVHEERSLDRAADTLRALLSRFE